MFFVVLMVYKKGCKLAKEESPTSRLFETLYLSGHKKDAM